MEQEKKLTLADLFGCLSTTEEHPGQSKWIEGMDFSWDTWDGVRVGIELRGKPDDALEPVRINDHAWYVNKVKFDEWRDTKRAELIEDLARECMTRNFERRIKYCDALGLPGIEHIPGDEILAVGAKEKLPMNLEDIEHKQAPIVFGKCKLSELIKIDISTDEAADPNDLVYWAYYLSEVCPLTRFWKESNFPFKDNEAIKDLHEHFDQEFSRACLSTVTGAADNQKKSEDSSPETLSFPEVLPEHS